MRLSLRGILILFISDITVFYQVLLVQSYKIKINTEPKFILDCGANIGSSSVFFVNLFPLAQIIAVEPELENFKILVKNTVPHKNIILVNRCIWSHEERLNISYSDLGLFVFTIKEIDKYHEPAIKAVSIQQLMAKFQMDTIDILKVDIEGSEKELFKKNVDLRMPYVRLIIIKLRDGLRSGASKFFLNVVSKHDFYLKRNNENLIFYFKS